ncbi:MAG: 2,3-bisphosphoglycerate-independent phosphoglycerate mutase, partial [Candidatus Margulisiibacteriota bacterium]
MKYIILIGDGMADEPLPSLQGKTPLEAARTPNLDFIAKNGLAGYVRTVPRGMTPGSDVANMSVFGYDPKKYYTGRGPLEAASLGIDLKKDEVAFRCNLVYVANGIMQDFTAGHISTEEAVILLDYLQKELRPKDIRFVPGLSYRHLAIFRNGPARAVCAPPHDITGKKINNYLPRGAGAPQLKDLMQASAALLPQHALNQRREQNQKNPANMIWLWGQGKKPALPPFKKLFGKTGAVITAVHLLKGIGRLSGMEIIDVPGATGFIDTNYAGKARAALQALQA